MSSFRYYWQFGDGFVSAEQNPTHTYLMAGAYTWRLDVTEVETDTSTSFTGTVTVNDWGTDVGDVDASVTNQCWRYGFSRRQGFGFMKVTGDAWPYPPARVGILRMYDEDNYPHLLVLNHKNGLIYDIATYDGPDNSGLAKVWKDAVETDGSGGTEIAPLVQFPEDVAQDEDDFLKSDLGYYWTRPISEDKRGASGYDANGYPDGLTVQDDIYSDGERTTADATAEKISLPNHRYKFDTLVRGYRLIRSFSADRGPFSLLGRKHMYWRDDEPAAPDNIVSSEDGYQSEFAQPVYWLGYSRGSLIDRANGSEVTPSGASYSRVEGPDGVSNSALQLTGALTLGSMTISSGTLLLWSTGSSLTITIGGATVGALTRVGDTSTGWSLYYATGVTGNGSVVITPYNSADIFDVRGFSSTISANALTYLYNNVNSGDKNMLPGV